MATSGEGFAISLAFYFGGMFIIVLLFSYWRRLGWTQMFYGKKIYAPPKGRKKPKALAPTWFGWVRGTLGMTEKEVLQTGGMDALMYLKTLRFGFETFAIVTILACAIILPINLTSGYVDDLMGQQYDPTKISQYMYWLPAPAPAPEGETTTQTETIKPPEMYNTSIPPAPPGLIWWQYLPGVPPLPPVSSLGPGYERYGWRYDQNYQVIKYEFTDLDKTTMTNVPSKSSRLYAHAIIAWAVTIAVLYQLRRYCKIALNLRLYHLQNSPLGAESHSVLCLDIPGIATGTMPERLGGSTISKLIPKSVMDKATAQVNGLAKAASGKAKKMSMSDNPVFVDASDDVAEVGEMEDSVPDRWEEAAAKVRGNMTVEELVDLEFRTLYQDNFSHAHIIYDTTILDDVFGQYEKLKEKAYNSIDLSVSKFVSGKKVKMQKSTVVGAAMGDWGKEKYGMKPKKVDAFEFYIDRLTFLRDAIQEEQMKAKEKYYPSAFVTMKTRMTAVVASQAMMSEDLSAWICCPAPEPQEIIWSNLKYRAWERNVRHKVYLIAYWCLVAFYMIPVSAVQVLISTNSLVGWMQTIPIASTLLTAILPGLALRIFMILLPPIILMLLRKAGVYSGSGLDLGLVSYIFIFQVITVFIGSFIAGTFANQFQQLIDDPGSIVQVFGTAAPQTSIFFMTYILVQACWEVPLAILNIVGLVIFKLKMALAATDAAKKRVLSDKDTFDYGGTIPDDSMTFLLGLTFCLAGPLIAPIVLIYFGTRYIVNKYQLVYRSEENYQSGGQAWTRVFDQYITGLITFQIVMIFILAIKETIGPPIITIPLPFITLIFAASTRSKFWRPMKSLSLMCAQSRDEEESAMVQEEVDVNAYQNPSFHFDEEEHKELLRQCQILKEAQEANDFSLLQQLVANSEPTTSDVEKGEHGKA